MLLLCLLQEWGLRKAVAGRPCLHLEQHHQSQGKQYLAQVHQLLRRLSPSILIRLTRTCMPVSKVQFACVIASEFRSDV
jgi:hypothetical protein